VRVKAGATALLLVVLAACGGGADARPTPTPPATPISEPTLPPQVLGDPGVTVENVVQACQVKDAALLSSFLAAPVDPDEIEAMFARGTDVRLAVRRPAEIEGSLATVELTLEVHGAIDNGLIDRTWELEQGEDGVWRLTELPDCY
jgi:hypothetical protein